MINNFFIYILRYIFMLTALQVFMVRLILAYCVNYLRLCVKAYSIIFGSYHLSLRDLTYINNTYVRTSIIKQMVVKLLYYNLSVYGKPLTVFLSLSKAPAVLLALLPCFLFKLWFATPVVLLLGAYLTQPKRLTMPALPEALSTTLFFAVNLSLLLFLPYLNDSTLYLYFEGTGYTLGYLLPWSFEVSALAIPFLYLVVTIMPLVGIWCWNQKSQREGLYRLLTLITVLLCLAFCSGELITFFFFFESLLFPMFFFVGLLGSRTRRLKAAYLLAMYTVLGSVFLLVGIIILYTEVSTTQAKYLPFLNLPYLKQLFIWFCLFSGFAIKVPLYPLHLWLPEAHVEAPTSGSVILAAFLLKLGGFGILRFVYPYFPFASYYMLPIITALSLLGVVHCSLTALRQIDIKRIIAYSSVAHMNLGVLGLCAFNIQGWHGFYFLMIAHGYVASALFFLVGVLYDRLHTKLVPYYGGLCQLMPLFSIYLFLFTIANFSFPGTANFVGELLLLVGIIKSSVFVFAFVCIGLFFGSLFSILAFNKVIFGPLKASSLGSKLTDLTRRETFVLTWLAYYTLLLGFYPNLVLDATFSGIASRLVLCLL